MYTIIYTLSLHDALPISASRSRYTAGWWTPNTGPSPSTKAGRRAGFPPNWWYATERRWSTKRSEEHTSELQSLRQLVCRLLLDKKKIEQEFRAINRIMCA